MAPSELPEPAFSHVVEARAAMATRFEIVLPGTDRTRLQAAGEAVLDEVERLEAQLSRFRESSEVSGLNAYAAFEPVRVEPRLFALLRLALAVARSTDSAFDPTVGPLLALWGTAAKTGALPSSEALDAARGQTGFDRVALDEDESTVRFLAEGMSLDLGAIGKGYALDRGLEILDEIGVASALFHGGTSTVYALGAPPGGDSWRVALRDPRREEGTALGEVRLRDRALSVSAPHGRTFTAGDRTFGHVLDPRTGEPIQGALLAAAAHASATLTDALSTALLVLGPEGLPELAARYPDVDFLVVAERESGAVLRTAGPGEWALRIADCGLGTPNHGFDGLDGAQGAPARIVKRQVA